MKDFLDKVLEMLGAVAQSTAAYLADVMGFVLIVLAGFVVGKLLKFITGKVLVLIRLDAISERADINEVLRRGGVREPLSMLMARTVGWLTVLLFFFIALSTLDIPQVQQVLSRLFLYIPNILVAAAIMFVAYLMSNFLSRAALVAAVNAGFSGSGAIARLIKVGVFVFALSMALEQLGIGKSTIVMAFTIIFGGIVLALAIAFGLGGQDAAKRYLQSRLDGGKGHKEEEKEDEFTHI